MEIIVSIIVRNQPRHLDTILLNFQVESREELNQNNVIQYEEAFRSA